MSSFTSAVAPSPPPNGAVPIVIQPVSSPLSEGPLSGLSLPHLAAHTTTNPEVMLAIFLLSSCALLATVFCYDSYQSAADDPDQRAKWLLYTAIVGVLYLLLIGAGFKLAYL